ncbi:MAG: hypothetical protein OXB84_04265, partial [Halobacteriovoraceae bacterium]|nr:hypothetical protein [Halobacteriovoraceae bacterium]
IDEDNLLIEELIDFLPERRIHHINCLYVQVEDSLVPVRQEQKDNLDVHYLEIARERLHLYRARTLTSLQSVEDALKSFGFKNIRPYLRPFVVVVSSMILQQVSDQISAIPEEVSLIYPLITGGEIGEMIFNYIKNKKDKKFNKIIVDAMLSLIKNYKRDLNTVEQIKIDDLIDEMREELKSRSITAYEIQGYLDNYLFELYSLQQDAFNKIGYLFSLLAIADEEEPFKKNFEKASDKLLLEFNSFERVPALEE